MFGFYHVLDAVSRSFFICTRLRGLIIHIASQRDMENSSFHTLYSYAIMDSITEGDFGIFFFICSWLFFTIRRFVWLIFIIFNVAFIAKKPHLPALPTPIGTIDVGSPITTSIRQLKIKVLITHLDLQFTKCFQYVLKMSIMYNNMHLKYPTYCTFSKAGKAKVDGTSLRRLLYHKTASRAWHV